MGGERRRARGGGSERERARLRHWWGFEGGGVRERPRLTSRGAPRRVVGGAGRGGGAGDRGRSGLVTIRRSIQRITRDRSRKQVRRPCCWSSAGALGPSSRPRSPRTL